MWVYMGGSATLKLDAPAAFTGTIGLVATSTIDLAGITASSATYDGSTLTINETNGQQLVYNKSPAAWLATPSRSPATTTAGRTSIGASIHRRLPHQTSRMCKRPGSIAANAAQACWRMTPTPSLMTH